MRLPSPFVQIAAVSSIFDYPKETKEVKLRHYDFITLVDYCCRYWNTRLAYFRVLSEQHDRCSDFTYTGRRLLFGRQNISCPDLPICRFPVAPPTDSKGSFGDIVLLVTRPLKIKSLLGEPLSSRPDL